MTEAKIGEKIKEVLDQRNMKLKDFAEEIGLARQNIYRIFEKESIDTDLLVRISTVLNHDFFNHFQPNRPLSINTSVPNESSAGSANELKICKQELEMAQREIDYLKKIIALMEERTELLIQKNKG
jgi:transcriptional regulator with XRE-family HTH domain